MTPKATVMDREALLRAVARMTHQVIEKNCGAEDVCILGVKSRGVPLAKMLCENISRFAGEDVPVGFIDITRHRDDISDEDKMARTGESSVPCDITDKNVIIVDDVLYTGRTSRAAIECVFSFGRPKSVQLLVLVDRGHRELPIRPDYVGKNVPTSKSETVRVLLDETDGETGVYLMELSAN